MIFARRAPRDPVADQLRALAKQGSGMAKVAHAFAFVLILLFSAGSLVALAGDALAHVLSGWQSGRVDIPSAISVGVSTLLVPCMDVAMLYAASMLRLLATRQATRRDMRIHAVVLGGVALVEAATYIYMAWVYEHPATWAAWALIVARALAAPLIGVYLSMARALPVTPRDILYQGELAAGAGVLRDVALAANDQSAPLAQKMALYGAAAEMRPADRSRLDEMIKAVRKRTERETPPADPLDEYQPLHTGLPTPPAITPSGPRYPTGGGSPVGMRVPGYAGPDSPTFPGTQAWESVAEEAGTLTGTRAVATVQPTSGNSPERDAQQAYVNTYLNRLPLTSRKALREHLNIRYDDARALYETWYWEYGGAAKIVAAKTAEREQARERSAQVAQ